ncbi:ArdC-like ssDNA-binding domain-containing protein [Microlunatus ginsengisoli]|uniref:Toprim domain-containing protein n=1 Tax=Microlunatus ginsengisoli TaxID=363863 RepID=A0ABP7A2H0_9ACTN
MTPDRIRTRSGNSGTPAAVSLEELHDRLRRAVDALESGEQWQAWLEFARGFHRYSFNNLILIWSQRPDATTVASYRTWQAKGRQVRKGETGIRVLAPILRRTPVVDDHGQPVRGDDGWQRTRQHVVGFRPVPVFDLSQTDGPPIPEPARPVLLAGDAPAGLWDALAAEVTARGYRLLRGSLDDLHGANGLTNPTRREVWVRHDVQPAQAVKTLAHELGHILLHTDPDQPDPADPDQADTDGTGGVVCAGVREVEAESVAYLVAAAHGLDSDTYTFPYVASWASGPAAAEGLLIGDIVTRTGARVMRASAELIDATTGDAITDPAGQALAMLIADAHQQTAVVREQASRHTAVTVTVDQRRTLLGVVADSQLFFRNQLATSWVPGYLARRGFADMLDRFGYAPARWTGLVDHLARLGYSDAQIEAAGMASRARTGRLVDRFRDRLMLPIEDHHGVLVGFVGRVGPDAVDDRYSPRYLNSPATAVFNKGEVLFGLGGHATRMGAGWTPVLCEGPLDAVAVDLAAARTGARMVGLAACGTAFTPRHAELLTQLVGDGPVCLAFDADPAGRHATDTAWRRLTDQAPRPVTAAALPAGTDPTDLIAAGRHQQLADLVRTARPAAQVVCDNALAGIDLDDNPARRLAGFRQLLPDTTRVPPADRADHVWYLATRLNIDPTVAAAEATTQRILYADQTCHHLIGQCQQIAAQLDTATETDPDRLTDRLGVAAPTRRLT